MLRNNEWTSLGFSLKDVEFFKEIRREEAKRDLIKDPKQEAVAIKDRLGVKGRSRRN